VLTGWSLIDQVARDEVVRRSRAQRAGLAMFAYTDTEHAPLTVVKSNDKKRARVNAPARPAHPGPRRQGHHQDR
jgi:polyphosphate kinase 2 (PPK2 family)